MLNSAIIEFKLIRKYKITWILFSLFLILLIYSMIFSIMEVQKLDNQIFQVLSHSTPSDGKIDISQPLGELKELAKVINPLALVNNNLILLIMIGSILFGIFGAVLVGSEFKQRTVQIRASHYGWAQSVGSKLILLFLVAVMMSIFVSIVSYVEGYFSLLWAKKELHQNEVIGLETININVFYQMVIASFTLFFYGTLGLIFSLITRSTLVGGIIAFLVPYIERFFANFSLEYLFPTTWIGVLIEHNFLIFQNSFARPTILTNVEISPIMSLILILLLNIVLSIFSFYFSKKQIV
ncbi:hypothetical protein [Bacillus sp. AFS041924]|uniref:hypothetical protein n=1 Tax=Bacillus sp. AFS041924 TaxID=2033503 RepID=UPI000BFC0729|nr:hypothetical protein [Bacillus sp. AFS041924]PGS50519.1 hypothetical protein COC46_13010 [Bacillus sp. AFS041924]